MNRLAVGTCALLAAASASADEAALLEKIEALEERVQQLESEQVEQIQRVTRSAEESRSADWTRRVRLSGSADAGLFGGDDYTQVSNDAFTIWDARFFVDANLGRDVRLQEATLFRDIGFDFEWNLVRIGYLQNNVGNLYVDFQGVGDSDWINAQVGRFQIPVGEAYLDYSQGYAERPFVTNSFGPWYWDEGVKLYSIAGAGPFGYVASIENGDTAFNTDSDSDKQVTLKLFTDPLPWLHLSASALRSGEIGHGGTPTIGTGTPSNPQNQNGTPAQGSLWLGESWARAFGSGTSVPNYENGVEVADGPNRLRESWLVGGDAIVDFEDKIRIWGAYGQYKIDSQGPTLYDRTLAYWIAEVILRGAWLGEGFRPFYAGARVQSLGTTDTDKGYLLDFRRSSDLGYNMHELLTYSGVLGWDITDWLRLRTEYSHQDIDLVRGVNEDIREDAKDSDYWAVELGGHF
ncbi:MAG TPA: hypothetical protein VMS55_22515 [Myxococcota bacterium]|nr:hypothetical protein [Myxococcota bacterium]